MMSHMLRTSLLLLIALAPVLAQQAIDEAYTAEIRKQTTDPRYLTELVDHLPASASVPTPAKLLGHIAGAEGYLTYTKDIHRYLRDLAAASPRVRVLTQGHSEEGRETLLVVISSEPNLRRLDRIREITHRLADPRGLSEDEARRLAAEGAPIYWASGSIHSPETGSPEMLMELAYRLAVEESPFIRQIRKGAVVLLTPVLEVDGRDRQVDLWNYEKAHPDKAPPPLVYWGKYVAHDNNRDGLGLALALSRTVMRTFLAWRPQVLHDLHESIPFLYTSTGMGPYNAWLDPIVINEWQELAYHEVEGMTRRGVPGVWTHGFYNGWGANYMVISAQGHNSIGRFYETFGNRTPETLEREVPESFTSRRWYRSNPPLRKVKWSLRDNVNLQQSALLLALNYTARNGREFLENFYLKSRRSVEKARREGPAAWVIPAATPRPLAAAELVNLLQLQGVEVHRLSVGADQPLSAAAGSYVIRMDQPYSRMADMMLDRQYYDPKDSRPYDDTGWTAGALRGVETVRVTDPAILAAAMEKLAGPVKPKGSLRGPEHAAVYVIAHHAETPLATLRYRLPGIKMMAAEQAFEVGGERYAPGAVLVPVAGSPADLRQRLSNAVGELGLRATGLASLPKVPSHELGTPRIALVHTWRSTGREGWVRIALDGAQIPYDYISTHEIRDRENLRDRYDVIFLGPTPESAQRIVNGLPMRGDPIPWQGSALTPNIGTSPDQTPDIRGGMELEGVLHLKRFLDGGGLLITVAGNASLPIDYGLIDSVSIQRTKNLKVQGSVLNATVADRASPIAYGYPDKLAVYFDQSPVFRVTTTGGYARRAPLKPPSRPTGRGSKSDPDIPQGRRYVAPKKEPKVAPGEELPLDAYTKHRYHAYLPRLEEQPRVVLRFAEEKDLLVSGMLGGGGELARKPAVVDVPCGQGHVVLFANNPMWRASTQGSYFLVWNAVLNWDHLVAGRRPKQE